MSELDKQTSENWKIEGEIDRAIHEINHDVGTDIKSYIKERDGRKQLLTFTQIRLINQIAEKTYGSTEKPENLPENHPYIKALRAGLCLGGIIAQRISFDSPKETLSRYEFHIEEALRGILLMPIDKDDGSPVFTVMSRLGHITGGEIKDVFAKEEASGNRFRLVSDSTDEYNIYIDPIDQIFCDTVGFSVEMMKIALLEAGMKRHGDLKKSEERRLLKIADKLAKILAKQQKKDKKDQIQKQIENDL